MNTRANHRAPRPSLTNEQLANLTVDEFVQLKLTDDEKARLREINLARERGRTRRAARLAIEEKPILMELRNAGFAINSVWDLVNTSHRYERAIPILLKHLLDPYSDRTREGIARALAVPEQEVQSAWRTLVEEYRKAPEGRGSVAPDDSEEFPLRAKDGLAVALSATVTDATIEELIALAKDPANGDSRLLLLRGIRKSKNPAAKKAIEELASDQALAKEIASWTKRNKAGRRA